MHRKALVGRRARDGSRYKGEGRESGRGSPLWRLIMQSLATRAIEDKMLSHIRPSGKVSRSWDRWFPLSWLSRDRFCRDNRGRPRQTVPRVLNQSSFRGQIPRKTCTPRRKRKRNGGGGLCADGIPHPWGRWTVEGISDWASSRYLNHVGRKNRNRAHVHLYRYSATFIPSLFLSSTQRTSLLFFHLFFPDPAHFILLHHPRRPSVIRVSLIFSDRFFWAACSLFFGQLSAPSRDLIDDRFDYLRPAQSISLHTWVGSSTVSRFDLPPRSPRRVFYRQNLADPTGD